MKIGMVLNTNDSETVFNALRLGVKAIEGKHQVKIFLLGSGVELEDKKESSNVCPMSTMADLLQMVEESDRVLTFG